MVFEPNANNQDLKKIRSYLQCFEGRQFSCGVFSAIITLKMWQTMARGESRRSQAPANHAASHARGRAEGPGLVNKSRAARNHISP